MSCQWRSQTLAIGGGARHPEGPLTYQGPPISILPSDFGHFILQKWKKYKKEQKMSAESPLTSQGIPPQFQYSPRISATSFAKYDKTLIFCLKKMQKKRKMPAIWRPPTCDWGARAPCAPLAAPLRPTPDEWKCDIVKFDNDSPHRAWYDSEHPKLFVRLCCFFAKLYCN